MPWRGVLDRDLPRHREHAALARGVRDLRGRRAHERDERRDVDDRTAARGEHRRDAVLAAEPHALEVHVHHGVPGRLGGLGGAAVVGGEDAGVVVEHVQAAERVDGGARPSPRPGPRRTRRRGRTPPRRPPPRSRRRQPRRRPSTRSATDDARALGREQLGRDAAHALARAGDERDLAVESSHCISPVRFGRTYRESPGGSQVKVSVTVSGLRRLFGRDLAAVVDVARVADDAGIDQIVMPDHLAMGTRTDRYPFGDVPVPARASRGSSRSRVLAAMASATRRVRLATGVLIGPLRPALVVARTVATIDVLSRGRVDLGIGTGWQREEFTERGLPFRGRTARHGRHGPRVPGDVGAGAAGVVLLRRASSSPTCGASRARCSDASRSGSPAGANDATARRIVELGDGWLPLGVRDDGRRPLRPPAAAPTSRAPGAIPATLGVRTTIRVRHRRRGQRRHPRHARADPSPRRARRHRRLRRARPLHPHPGRHRLVPARPRHGAGVISGRIRCVGSTARLRRGPSTVLPPTPWCLFRRLRSFS